MSRDSKRTRAAREQVDTSKQYELADALALATKVAGCRFDETVEMAVKLGVDPRKADQNVRGTVLLPRGTGRAVRVLVFAKGEKEREASDEGAEGVGWEEMVKKIKAE